MSKKKSMLREVAVPRWKVAPTMWLIAPVYIGHLLFAKHRRVYSYVGCPSV